MYPAVMLDIESLDTRPTTHILSVAALPFDPRKSEVNVQAGRVWKLKAEGQEGRSISASTVRFWLAQPLAAYAPSWGTDGADRVVTVLLSLSSFITAHGDGRPRVWAHGPHFDISALENLFDSHKMAYPWAYNAIRDVRTLQDLAPEITEPPADHDPLNDCARQVRIVQRIYAALGRSA